MGHSRTQSEGDAESSVTARGADGRERFARVLTMTAEARKQLQRRSARVELPSIAQLSGTIDQQRMIAIDCGIYCECSAKGGGGVRHGKHSCQTVAPEG